MNSIIEVFHMKRDNTVSYVFQLCVDEKTKLFLHTKLVGLFWHTFLTNKLFRCICQIKDLFNCINNLNLAVPMHITKADFALSVFSCDTSSIPGNVGLLHKVSPTHNVSPRNWRYGSVWGHQFLVPIVFFRLLANRKRRNNFGLFLRKSIWTGICSF